MERDRVSEYWLEPLDREGIDLVLPVDKGFEISHLRDAIENDSELVARDPTVIE